MQRQTYTSFKRGRPTGKAHPMTFAEFWEVYLEHLPTAKNYRVAYEKAEVAVFKAFGQRRFRSFQAFKNAKMRFYRASKKPPTT